MEDSYMLQVSEQKFRDLYLCFYGYSKCEPLHSFGPAVRPNYIIHFISEGKGTYQVGERKYELQQGQGFLIEPETLTFYKADKEIPWSYLWIGFGGEQAEEYLKDIGLGSEQLTFQCTRGDELKAIIQTMLRHSRPDTADLYALQSLLYSFFAVLSKDTIPQHPAAYQRSNVYVQQAITYIRSNYFRGIGVQEIADYLSIDRSYLYSLFKQSLNVSPQDFLTQFRITRARELLSYTDISIESIALSCGYQDALVFSKAFKRAVGMTPTMHRKKHKNNILTDSASKTL